MTEKELQRCVLKAARLLGYLVAHFRPARTARGWRTPCEGDAQGFPDLVLVGHGRVLFRELKSQRGQPTDAQLWWHLKLLESGADSATWRPSDWQDGTILNELRGD